MSEILPRPLRDENPAEQDASGQQQEIGRRHGDLVAHGESRMRIAMFRKPSLFPHLLCRYH